MAIQAYVDDLNDLEESLHHLYVPSEDGRFRLDVEGMETSEEVQGLKTALEKEREARRDLRAQLDALGPGNPGGDGDEDMPDNPQGTDADDPTLERPAEMSSDALPEAEAGLQDPNPELPVPELETAADSLMALRTSLESKLAEAEARAAIVDARGAPELLLPILKDRLRAVETEEGFTVRVLDGKGQPRVKEQPKTSGDDGEVAAPVYFTVADLIDELRNAAPYARAFDGLNITGSGIAGAGRSDNGVMTVQISDQASLDANVAAIASGKMRVVV